MMDQLVREKRLPGDIQELRALDLHWQGLLKSAESIRKVIQMSRNVGDLWKDVKSPHERKERRQDHSHGSSH